MDQKDALRAFYHTTEDRYDLLPSQVLDDREDIETKRTAITLLAIVLAARQAMTDWFWNGVPDDGHVEHEMVLSSKLIRYQPEYGLDCDLDFGPDCTRVRNPGGGDIVQHRYQHQHHMADGQIYLSEQECSDQSKGATNPWSSLDDLQYIELLDLERASADELSSIDYLYIADVHATDHTKVEW
ncbi:hypothetical protein PG985_003838 [Apiospora marii]|uniref:uncharacterized protein n=1 Tax=Apiospora marii TaxID=335849 RepID=UPI0031300A49